MYIERPYRHFFLEEQPKKKEKPIGQTPAVDKPMSYKPPFADEVPVVCGVQDLKNLTEVDITRIVHASWTWSGSWDYSDGVHKTYVNHTLMHSDLEGGKSLAEFVDELQHDRLKSLAIDPGLLAPYSYSQPTQTECEGTEHYRTRITRYPGTTMLHRFNAFEPEDEHGGDCLPPLVTE